MLATGNSPADRDLGLRLLNSGITSWWSLGLSGTTRMPLSGGPATEAPPLGTLEPILQDNLGNPVVAVWLPKDADERWYIVPDGTDGDLVVGWLVQLALPAYVPNALRRVRSVHFTDPDLLTLAEAEALATLTELKERYRRRSMRPAPPTPPATGGRARSRRFPCSQ